MNPLNQRVKNSGLYPSLISTTVPEMIVTMMTDNMPPKSRLL